MKTIKVALAGNPNCGKTTLFNSLTGSNQYVGNWPGVTVEHKEGSYIFDDTKIKVIDLPGIYSFSANSLDEKASRDYILNQDLDLIINIVDASKLERNLYLTTQLIEMKKPVILVLNMIDVAKEKKIEIEFSHLSKHLGFPVIPIIARNQTGIEDLRKLINKSVSENIEPAEYIRYDSIVEKHLKDIELQVKKIATESNVNARWLSVKLLENDELAVKLTKNKYLKLVNKKKKLIENHVGDEIALILADGRFGFVNGLVHDVVKKGIVNRRQISDSIDKIVLNKFLGLPIFILVMYSVFVLTMNVSAPFIDFFDSFFGTIFVDGFKIILEKLNTPDWITLFLADGIGGGIQTVTTFIPPIFFIFLSLSFLEDSGYMSRAAFIMDKHMRKIGLPGKAFIPMLVGFGCTVPAILATRTLENKKDRLLTILITPFMSCGARLPVYAIFTATFFGARGGIVLFTIYFTGIFLAILSGLLFKKTILKSETSTFVMELPTYHIPTLNGVSLHTWTRLKGFVWRAGQAILIAVVVLMLLNSIGPNGIIKNNSLENSYLSIAGKMITPILHPIGIENDNWPATVGLITGIFAKEAIVGTLETLYFDAEAETDDATFLQNLGTSFVDLKDGVITMISDLGDPLGLSSNSEDEEETISKSFEGTIAKKFKTKSAAFAYMLFVLIYVPCLATIAAVFNETNYKWAIFSVAYLTILAWIVSTLFYQITNFNSHPLYSITWISISVGITLLSYLGFRIKGKVEIDY